MCYDTRKMGNFRHTFMQRLINDLIPDIQTLLRSKEEWFDGTLCKSLSEDIASRLHRHWNTSDQLPTLRLSQMGPRCPCALWYSINRPEMGEPLQPWAQVKYGFGHILEALAITLAKAAHHEVTGEQDELRLDDIVGHRDCIIDGAIVDVKSISSIGFQKFKTNEYVDTFGYYDQLCGYVLASANDPLVRIKDKGYLLLIDKQLGHMYLHEQEITDEHASTLRNRIARYKQIVELQSPPACMCGTVPYGSSGNIALDVKASYSPFKYCCKPHLRTFLYAKGPVYLTHVVKKPDVMEIDRHGKAVYH